MYFAEHRFLGDSVDIHQSLAEDPKSPNGHTASTMHLTNGLAVSYGEINGLAGDYFGLDKPISSEPNHEQMKKMFRRWFDMLDFSPAGKLKAEAIRKELNSTNEKALAVMSANSDNAADELAAVYKNNPLDITHLEDVSKDTRWAIGSTFMQLLEGNVDHFAAEARATYDAGHAVALELAAEGHLDIALAVNGFADHFLEDSFAAGHIRVPRREIAEIAKTNPISIPSFSKIINASSNVMHNEDGELGLWLESPSGEKWKSFGDGRLPGKDNSSNATTTNLDQCLKAVKQSIAEVHDAYNNKKVIQPSEFAAWHHAPIIAKVSEHPQNHAPLLKVQEGKLMRRVGGVSSSNYKLTRDLGEWVEFWTENFAQVEDQVKLMISKVWGRAFG
ncbi:unnamed protein product [Fusarium graminearum]|nr:hypothetical protein FG05_04796 [Fusarium graminearum]CAF3473750.1 unnamed protein product [Fusarium graminearum]